MSLSWQVTRLGPPEEALSLSEQPVRAPGPGEAQVAVEAVGLNHPDLLLCAGRYQERPQLPFSPGFEAAGTVVETGPGCGVELGQRVVVVPELPEGGMQRSLTVPEGQLFPVPEAMPFGTAAVLHVAWSTAHAAVHHRAGLTAGEVLLVTGGSGGVGSAAVQLGKAAGAYVVATATGPRKAEACSSFGADAVVDLSSEDLVSRVRQLTDGRGADVVVDVVGLVEQLRRCVAFEGRLVVVGFAGGTIPQVPANHVLLRNYSLVGLHLAAYRRQNPQLLREIHAELVDLWRRGVVAPLVEKLPFEQAPAALRRLADREVIGRLVLRC
ncbi:MAG TPA: NADPH:quinone oxidoreductase family protein [Marmoricola sp.]|nr:NADPH:quinone oxidoreductase family protein [Marmoricola sp.]